jgi:hypothetical protein
MNGCFHMSCRTYPIIGVLMSLLAATGCASNNPAAPGSATATVTTPRPVTPANLAQIANNTQPVTLVVQNAVVTQTGGTTYAFEVGTDAAFTNKVQTKSGVPEGSGGQTSLTLGTLPAGTTYYWHAQATAGGTTGVFGTAFQFTIGPAITISAPTPVAPANGASTTTLPTLTVANAARIGPAGVIAYRFDISTSPTFATVVVTGTVPEGTIQTSFTPATLLTLNATYYWRATGIDQTNAVAGTPSAVWSFTASSVPLTAAGALAAQEGVVLWPGVQPPGVPGQARMGTDWNVEVLTDYTGHQFLNPLLDALRVFDLLDRGMDPQGAVDWLNGNGYHNGAAYYPTVQVIGFPQEYMALINGAWDMVLRLGS